MQSVRVFRDVESLRVSWKPGAGRAERVRLLLRDSAGLEPVRNHALGNATAQYTVRDLTPGRVYNMSIVTEAAGMQNAAFLQERTGAEAFTAQLSFISNSKCLKTSTRLKA